MTGERSFMLRLCLVVVMALLMSACGKKGRLIYPDLLVPESPSSVTLRQTGPGMKLSFLLPQKDRAGQPLVDLAGVRILKREALPGQPQECSACMDEFRLFKTLYVDVRESSVQRYGTMMIVMDGAVTIGRTYSYQVVPFTKAAVDGQGAPQLTATMVEPPPHPVLRVIPSPTDIRLEFDATPSAKGTLVGYNLYRAVKGETLPFLPLNSAPLQEAHYTDSGLVRHLTYSYAVRMVVRMPAGEMVESSLSNLADGALLNDEE